MVTDHRKATSLREQAAAILPEGFASLRFHQAKAASLSNALEQLGASIQSTVVIRGADQQQAIVDAIGQLSALLETVVSE